MCNPESQLLSLTVQCSSELRLPRSERRASPLPLSLASSSADGCAVSSSKVACFNSVSPEGAHPSQHWELLGGFWRMRAATLQMSASHCNLLGAQNLILAREIRTMQKRARPKMQAIIHDCCKIIRCKKQFKVILFIAAQTLHTGLLFEGSVMSPDVGRFGLGPNEHQIGSKMR